MDISLTAYNQTFQAPWVGTVELDQAGKWFDDFMLLVSAAKNNYCKNTKYTNTLCLVASKRGQLVQKVLVPLV